MRVKSIGSNMTEVTTVRYTVLISYETPVAFFDHDDNEYYRTSTKWSATTTRHINKWLEGKQAKEVEQDIIDELLD